MARPRATPKDTSEEDPKSSRQFVTAVSRGFEVLRSFVPEGKPLGNQEIAARSGLPKPTVSRIAFTLTELGYLVYSAETEKYRLGPGVLAFAQAFGNGTGITELAKGPLQQLADDTRGTVAIGQADRHEMVYIALHRSVSRIMLRQDIGSRIPMATTAMGQAYLHALPAPRRKVRVEKLAEFMGDERQKFLEIHERTGEELRTRGFCVVAGVWEHEINGAATAFKLDDGRSVLAMNIGGPSFWLTEENLYGEIGDRMMETREALIDAGILRLNLM
ncbi:IclR family transcriptional regulator [Fontisubflavum oceani]|uniref:IclR family transcriptional regulator n=1 Tax=Fontisubflavum oceani TaxID=2978973 RepID=UPI0025B56E03|nr:IclR family transcriptional regulator [Fontisubflavum oceani]WJY21757.1 IclR family transcriptional regulator [Fontisubflavum oceani]